MGCGSGTPLRGLHSMHGRTCIRGANKIPPTPDSVRYHVSAISAPHLCVLLTFFDLARSRSAGRGHGRSAQTARAQSTQNVHSGRHTHAHTHTHSPEVPPTVLTVLAHRHTSTHAAGPNSSARTTAWERCAQEGELLGRRTVWNQERAGRAAISLA